MSSTDAQTTNGRSEFLPTVEQVASHPLVDEPHGPIFILKGRQETMWMENLLKHVAVKQCPKNRSDAEWQGYSIVRASDSPVFLWRDMAGTQKPEDDRKKVWTRPGSNVPTDESNFMRDVRDRILGDRTKITPKKASISLETGEYEGGGSFRAIGGGAYQTTRNMHAPQKGRKTLGVPLNEHAELVRDVLKVGALAAMAGLKDGPKGLEKLLEDRAEYLNIPRVGDSSNIAFPTQQLNIAGAVEAEENVELTSSLGKYGGLHADCGDSASAVTGMTCLTERREDVEEDVFFIEDFGIAIILDEFDTAFFCGLHFHGGTQPRYIIGPRISDDCHVRLTSICYGPASFFDVPSSEAFITLPGKEGVLKVCNEMKDWSKYMHFSRVASSQSTYTSDGEALMDSPSNFEHFVHDIVHFVAYAIDQYPRHELPRFNRDRLISSFTSVRDGKRAGVSSWDMGPGWIGKDNDIGTEYEEDLKALAPDELMKLHHSDTKTIYPYGNEKVFEHTQAWKAHHESMTKTIALCMSSDFQNDESIKPNPNKRRTTTRNARRGKAIGRSAMASKRVISAGRVSACKRKKSDKAGDVDAPPAKKRRTAAHTKSSSDHNPQVSNTSSSPIVTSTVSDSYLNPVGVAFSNEVLGSTIASLASHVVVAAKVRDQVEAGAAISEMKVLLERDDIHTLWKLKSKMEARRSTLAVETAISKAQLLTLCCATWAWLDNTIDEAYRSTLSGSSHWMKPLAVKVDSLVVTGRSADLDESHFFPGSSNRRRTYKFKAVALARRTSSLANFSSAIRPIIMSWFNFPSSPVEFARGTLLKKIVECLGVGALYLPSVWDIYDHLSKTLDPAHRKPTKRAATEWLRFAMDSLDAVAREEPRAQLQDLVDAIATTCAGAVDHRVWNGLVGLGKASESSLEGASVDANDGGGMEINGDTFKMVSSPSSNDIGCLEDMLDMFIDQIETLYPILDNPTIAPQHPGRSANKTRKATHKFLDLVFKNSDKKLPFRDLASSRRRILEEGGPFSASNLRTRKGFFSVMVHRGITHHSPFLVNHGETMFEDLEAFKSTVESYGEREDKFFCDPSAYGMWTGLNISAADVYWNSSGKEAHLRWLTKTGRERIEFTELYQKFSTSDFPNIGPLIGFLIASDYAIAGVVKTPTPEEMGGIIYDIGKGGLAGLMTLGFRCDNREDTAVAFRELHSEMCRKLDSRRREEMGFSVFVLEHMLCKFKRLSIKLYRDIVAARTVN